MRTIESTLEKERFKLERIIEEAEKRLNMAPKGHIRIRKWNGVIEYYYKEDYVEKNKINNTNKNGRYLRKSEESLARGIVQRDYDIRVINNAKNRIKSIDDFIKKYEKNSLKKLYEKTNPCRRELIEISEISDEEYIKRWQAVKYSGKSFEYETQEIITERGERVRSKSEKIIADKLYMLEIPYRYEYPLILKDKVKLYPDFTILKMPEREEVYLEHFGMMDDNDYAENMLLKLNTYEKNGIYLGVNLFFTHETKKVPLNIRALDGLIKHLFCAE